MEHKFRAAMNQFWELELDEMFGVPIRQVVPPAPKTLQTANGRIAALAKYVTKPMKLKALFKGQTLRASVGRNGIVRFNGKTYTSPSLAGAAACKKPTCNGWVFWRYERSPEEWVQLDKLRS
jgi:hypothetical protein